MRWRSSQGSETERLVSYARLGIRIACVLKLAYALHAHSSLAQGLLAARGLAHALHAQNTLQVSLDMRR